MEVVDVTALAVTSLADLEEAKPRRLKCADCDRPATRQDGRCGRHSGFRMTAKAKQAMAEELVKRNAIKYAKLHMQAAERAALKGDAEPSQWGLLHSRAVQPVQEKAAANVGVQVYVGTVLPGLREP